MSFITGLLIAPADLTEPPPPRSAVLFDAEGRYFATIRSPEVRSPVPAKDIPAVMRQAIIAAEDARFLTHSGVDPIAVLRATYRDLRQQRVAQGGSTITQQYVKNVYVGNERTAMRKIREAALAIRVEQRMSKDEILTAYLNGVYLGNGTYGVEAASRFYFGIPARELDLGRAAMLAGIVPAPSLRNPVRARAVARDHQLATLNRMVELGMITSQQASDAFRTSPTIVKQRTQDVPTEAPEFADLVQEEVKEAVGEDNLFRAGLRVRTTLDLTMQQAARAAAREILSDPDDPDVAIVAIDPRNGDLKAIHSSGYVRGGFNYATMGHRSTGSAIKPFALLAAFTAGKKDTDVYPNPRVYRYGRGPKDTLRNYEFGGGGSATLRRATWVSSNTVFAKLTKDLGVAKVVQAAKDAGVEGRMPLTIPFIVGNNDVTPMSMARGFATIANHGVRHDVRTLLEVRVGGGADTELTGEVTEKADAKPPGKRVFKAEVADLVSDVLLGVVRSGTARSARQSFPVFGKTGTQEDYTDAWFIGCSPELCIATWMGYGKGLKPMRRVHGVGRVTGGSLPAKIFDRFYERLADFRAALEPDVEVTARPRRRTPTPTPKATTPRPTTPAPKPTTPPPTTPPPSPSVSPPIPTLRPTAGPSP